MPGFPTGSIFMSGQVPLRFYDDAHEYSSYLSRNKFGNFSFYKSYESHIFAE